MIEDTGPQTRTYTAQAGQKVFVYPILVPSPEDLRVYVSGVLQTLWTTYQAEGFGSSDGVTVTFYTAPLAGSEVAITTDVAYTQPSDYTTGSRFSADDHEASLDRMTLLARQNRDLTLRSPKFPLFSSPQLLDMTFPPPEAGRYLRANGSGTGLVWSDIASSGGPSGPVDAQDVSYRGSNVEVALDDLAAMANEQEDALEALSSAVLDVGADVLAHETRIARVEVHQQHKPLVTDSPWLADATGVNDCFAAFSQCRDATGGCFDIPKGRFKLLSPFPFTNMPYDISGAGRHQTYLDYSGNQDCFVIDTAFAGSIRNLCLHHLRSTGTPTAGAAINVRAANFIVVEHVLMEEPYTALRLKARPGAAVNVGRFKDIVIGNQEEAGVYADGTDAPVVDLEFKGLWINGSVSPGNGAKGPGVGYYFTGQIEGSHIIGGDAILAQRGIWIDSATLTPPKRVSSLYIIATQLDSNAHGITARNCVACEMIGCWVATSLEHGIYLDGAIGFEINGCHIFNHGKFGIYVEATSRHTLITGGNRIVSNSTSAPNQYSAIGIASGTTDFIITSNALAEDGAFPSAASQGWGVDIAPGASDRYVVWGNLVAGNTQGGVRDGGASATHKTVGANW